MNRSKNIFPKVFLLLMLLLGWSGVSWAMTTITSSPAPTGGKFADDTQWYTIVYRGQNNAGTYFNVDQNTNGELQWGSTSLDEGAYWCFVGDNTNGYKMYNLKTGVTMVLAAVGTGDNAHVKMVDAATANSDLSTFTTGAMTAGGKTAYNFIRRGTSGNAGFNNNGGYVAMYIRNAGMAAGGNFAVEIQPATPPKLGNATLKFIDNKGVDLPTGSVLFTGTGGEPITINASEGTHNFGDIIYSSSYFTSANDLYTLSTSFAEGVLTFTLTADPNKLQFSAAPSGTGWNANTHWYNIQNNRSNQAAQYNYRYISTAASSVNDNLTLKAAIASLEGNLGEAWAFVGDENGFYIQNAAYGPDFVLGSSSSGDNASATFKMVRRDNPEGYITTFTAVPNSVLHAPSTHSYAFRVGTSGNVHVHITNGAFRTWNHEGGMKGTNNDGGSSFTISAIDDEVLNSYTQLDVYHVPAGLTYNGTRTVFGKRNTAPYIILEKGEPEITRTDLTPNTDILGVNVVKPANSYIKELVIIRDDEFSPAPIDGQWASGTKWFTIRNHRRSRYVSVNNASIDDNMFQKWSGTDTKPTEAEGMWCFVQDGDKGFRIYNKAYGPDFVLAVTGANTNEHIRMYHLSEVNADNSHFHFINNNNSYNGKPEVSIMLGANSGGVGLNDISSSYLGVWSAQESNHRGDQGSALYIERVDESVANATRTYNAYKVNVVSDDASLASIIVPAVISYTTPAQQGSKQAISNGYYMLFEQTVNVPALAVSAFNVTSANYPNGVTAIEVGSVTGSSPTLPQIKLMGNLVLPHVVHRPNGNLWRAQRNNYNGTQTNTVGNQTEEYSVVRLKDESTTKLQHTGVFEITHFLAPGEQRELWMPSTSSSANGSNAKILNYMRWFDYQTEGMPDRSIVNLAADQVGDVYARAWYYQNGIVVGSSVNGVYPRRFVHINMPSDLTEDDINYEYTLANEATRYTDFGNNFTSGGAATGDASYLGTFTDPNNKAVGNKNLLEPTIGTRQIYHLRSAHEMAARLSACTNDKWLEEETITFPTRGTNLGNYKDVIPLDYNFIDYWAYNSKGELRSVKQEGTTIKTTVSNNGTGITIVSANCKDYLNESQVFVEADSWASRDAGHYVSFAYPNDGVITLGEGETSRTDTIFVRLNVDGTEYNIKKFILVFQNGVEAIPYYEVLQDVDHPRSDKTLAAQFGKEENPSGIYTQLNFHYPQNYLMKEPGDALTTGTGYYAFPYNFDEVSYSYYANGSQYVDWGEYGMRNNAQTATRHSSLSANPYFFSVNYLRELYRKKDAKREKDLAQAVLDNPDSDEQQRAEAEYHLSEAEKILAEVTDAKLQEAYTNNYYIYVDASEQPGQVGRLCINEKLCTGTRIYGTAWLSCATAYTASSPDPASVIFRFKGVREDGSMTTIYSYCPGQISNIARASDRSFVYAHQEERPNGEEYNQALWQQVAFSFVNPYPANEFEGFVLEVFNNCRGSSGGDIFLDDIRLFVKTPQVNVDNAAPICGDELSIVRISTDFDAIMDALQGNTHVGESTTYYGTYAILDKEIYDKRMAQNAEPTMADVEEAFNMALMGETDKSKCYSGTTFLPEFYAFHEIKFYSQFERHNHITYATLVGDNILDEAGYMYQYNNQNEVIGRNLVFNCKINDERIAGKQYYLVFHANVVPTDMTKIDKADYHDFFSMGEICCIRSEFKTMRAKMVKVEGSEELDPYNIDYCPGTSPTISLNSYGYDIKGELIQEHGVYYDWYIGTKEQFKKEYVWLDGHDIDIENIENYTHREILTAEDFCMEHCLMNFRYFYPNATAKELFDGTVEIHHFEKDAATDTEYELTAKMIAKLKEWTSSGKLRLHLTAISVDLSESDEQGMTHVLAIQQGAKLRYEHTDMDRENPILYCMDPVEISFRTKLEAPSASVGFADIDYDGTPYNRNKDKNVLYSLPLRINRKQIAKMYDGSMLTLPLRVINPSGYYKVDGDNDELVNTDKIHLEIDEDAKYVYVVETNDPQWSILSEAGGIEYLKPIGELKEIDADKVRTDGGINTLGIQFYSVTDSKGRRFEPNESYYYVLRTAFNEVLNEGVVRSSKYDVPGVQCKGNILIPLKIVPEYMKWTGKESRDWNNDRNWIRADYDELHAANQTSAGETPLANYSRNELSSNIGGQSSALDNYNGLPYDSNDKKESEDDMDMYIPMDKALHNGSVYANTFAYAPMADTKIIIPANAVQFPILANHALDTQDGKTDLLVLTDVEVNTPYIIYDMVAITSGKNFTAAKYYDNHVDGITFLPSAAMENAHMLDYNKAWVEYELDANRWYTVGSPLKNSFAGDWYSPTDGAKQQTPHFHDINYNEALNDRFRPAYYQRSWDREGNNIVYTKEGGQFESYVKADWSHVYNDAAVSYSAGGFSVKPDLDYMKVSDRPSDSKVLVRLPKADESYTYYDINGDTGMADDAQTGNRAQSYKLRSDDLNADGSGTITMSVANHTADNNFILLSNPFMASLDMDAFFAANTDLEEEYWIVDADRQSVSLKTSDEWVTTGTADARYVAPMQGFFVKKKENTTQNSVSAQYTADMQKALSPASEAPVLRARAAHTGNVIRLVAERDNASSTAVIVLKDNANDEGVTGEDCETFVDGSLMDAPTVYTTASGSAQSINVRRTLKMVPVGIISSNDDEVVLHIDLSQSPLSSVYLYDGELDTYTEVSNDTEISMAGNCSGRYFITTSLDDTLSTVETGIRSGVWTVSGIYCGKETKGLQPGLYIVDGVKMTVK